MSRAVNGPNYAPLSRTESGERHSPRDYASEFESESGPGFVPGFSPEFTPDYETAYESAYAGGRRSAPLPTWLWWSLAAVTVCSAAIVVGFFLLGMRAGQTQLDRARAQQVNISLDRAAQHITAGDLSAALAEYQLVLQIDADNEEALAWSEQLAQALGGEFVPALEAVQDDGTSAVDAPSGPLDELWREAQIAYDGAEWLRAVDVLEQIREQDADYRRERVIDLLYGAHRNLALDAEALGETEEALTALDSALALRPDAADLQTLRDTIATYSDIMASYGDDWAETVAELRAFGNRQPGYRDVETQLQAALVALGDEQADARQWCAAAQSYAEAAELKITPGIIFTRDQARERCRS